jgi:hypothetical protein
LSTQLGKDLQTGLQFLAFPLCLYFTWMIFRHVFRKSHTEAFILFVMVAVALAVMMDLSLLVSLWGSAQNLGTDFIHAL